MFYLFINCSVRSENSVLNGCSPGNRFLLLEIAHSVQSLKAQLVFLTGLLDSRILRAYDSRLGAVQLYV